MNLHAIGAFFDVPARIRRRRSVRRLENLSPAQLADLGLPAAPGAQLVDRADAAWQGGRAR